jgi:hypothetical protein
MADTTTGALKRTPLHEIHAALGAKIVPFAGYEMPVQYPSGITAEHNAVRNAAGLFDVSHMGEIEVAGRDAAAALQRITSNDVEKLKVGHAQYSGLLTPEGTFVEDLLVYRLAPDQFLLVVNASICSQSGRVFEARGHGALDAVDTPELGMVEDRSAAETLLRKIETIGKLIGDKVPKLASTGRIRKQQPGSPLVAIGASSGGPAALAKLLSGLPPDLAAPVLIVQHIDKQFAPGMADWLQQYSPWPVRIELFGDEIDSKWNIQMPRRLPLRSR